VLLEVGEEIGRLRWSPTGSEVACSDPSGVHLVDVATAEVSMSRTATLSIGPGEETLIITRPST
jgi:hypothetical protein